MRPAASWHGCVTKAHNDCADNLIMDGMNTNNIGDTIRIRRPPRVYTNERGRTVWMSDVEPVEFELERDATVSTNPYDSGQSVSN